MLKDGLVTVILQRYIKQTIAILLLRACVRVCPRINPPRDGRHRDSESPCGPRAVARAARSQVRRCFLIWKSRKCPARNCLVGSEADYCETAADKSGTNLSRERNISIQTKTRPGTERRR